MSTLTPTPFKVAVPQDAVDALTHRLSFTVLPPPEPHGNEPWAYGVPLADISRLLDHWRTKYDWRKHEAALNAELPQFTIPISVDGHGSFQAHFVHQKAKRTTKHKPIPLLFLHGWPGHFGEVRKILPLLTNPESDEDPVFHVVAPSLPGYGFSDAPKKAGFAHAQYAEFAHKIMLALGYDSYVVQGGDWGFPISHRIVYLYGPTHVKAWHTNFPVARVPTATTFPRAYLNYLTTPYSEAEKQGIERRRWFNEQANAYWYLQRSTPQTLAFALADSPVGLLAWIYDRLVNWTDDYLWTDDEVLDWVHIYLFNHTQSTSSATTSLRIYFEAVKAGDMPKPGSVEYYNGAVPLGISQFPKEIEPTPESWHPTLGRVVYSARHNKGGHFAAHERPEELVRDIRNTFGLPEVRSKF